LKKLLQKGSFSFLSISYKGIIVENVGRPLVGLQSNIIEKVWTAPVAIIFGIEDF
jgi:hypothetical protein